MHELMTSAEPSCAVATQTGIVPYEEAISVETEQFDWDKPMRFGFWVNGSFAGVLVYSPPVEGSRGTAFANGIWSAHLNEKYPRCAHECVGYGSTPDKAIEYALSTGIQQLRSAAAFGVELKKILKKKSTQVSLRLQKEKE